MDSINKIDEIINAKAKAKLATYIKNIRLSDIDRMNTHIEVPITAGYVCNECDGKEKAGKRFIRGDELLALLEKALYKKMIDDYQEKERSNFLNDLEQIRNYIRE